MSEEIERPKDFKGSTKINTVMHEELYHVEVYLRVDMSYEHLNISACMTCLYKEHVTNLTNFMSLERTDPPSLLSCHMHVARVVLSVMTCLYKKHVTNLKVTNT